ncbi:hypothetical protein TKK_0008057 [Trichogramma kaykai]
MDKYKFPPDRIYNVDETGISVVPKTSPKFLARTGKKQVGGLVACERGENVTAEICMSATGSYMPPSLIFPRVNRNELFLLNAPPGAWAEFHKSGYMQTDIFTRWMKKFIQFSHATLKSPVLLLLDGHSSHVKNLEVIELARDNGVIIVCFPPHCTHKMQPLDVGFNGPLNSYYGREVVKFQRNGNNVSLHNLFAIFDRAFVEAAKMSTAINSFKKCGLVPENKDAFAHEFKDPTSCETNSESFPSFESSQKSGGFTTVIKEIIFPKLPEAETPTTSKANEECISIPLSCLQPAFAKFLASATNSQFQLDQQPDVSINAVRANEIDDEIKNASFASSPVLSTPKFNKRGKAANITSDEYKENLIADKLRSMKKEKRKSTDENSNSRAKVPRILTNSNLNVLNADENSNLSMLENPFMEDLPFIDLLNYNDNDLKINYIHKRTLELDEM